MGSDNSSNNWGMLGLSALAALGGLFGGKKSNESTGSSSESQETSAASGNEKLDESGASEEAKAEAKPVEKKLENCIEITTPFLDRHNDWIQIFVEQLENGRLYLTDDGYIFYPDGSGTI